MDGDDSPAAAAAGEYASMLTRYCSESSGSGPTGQTQVEHGTNWLGVAVGVAQTVTLGCRIGPSGLHTTVSERHNPRCEGQCPNDVQGVVYDTHGNDGQGVCERILHGIDGHGGCDGGQRKTTVWHGTDGHGV